MNTYRKGDTVKVTDLKSAGDAIKAGVVVGDILTVHSSDEVSCDFHKVTKSGLKIFTLYNKRLVPFKIAYPNPPHKHAELIKAWADGADIECRARSNDIWVSPVNPRKPMWNPDAEYRIKETPQKTPEEIQKEAQIEKLEVQVKQLADDIAKLKE